MANPLVAIKDPKSHPRERNLKFGIEDRLDRNGGELRKRNEIEAQKIELLKQIEKNLSDKDKE